MYLNLGALISIVDLNLRSTIWTPEFFFLVNTICGRFPKTRDDSLSNSLMLELYSAAIILMRDPPKS